MVIKPVLTFLDYDIALQILGIITCVDETSVDGLLNNNNRGNVRRKMVFGWRDVIFFTAPPIYFKLPALWKWKGGYYGNDETRAFRRDLSVAR